MTDRMQLRLTGIVAVAMAVVYALWSLVGLIQLEGQLQENVLILRGVDLTSPEQLLAAWKDPALEQEVAALRLASGYVWYALRQAGMAALSITTLVFLLKRSLMAGYWIRFIACAMPLSMLAVLAATQGGEPSARVGLAMVSLLGGGLWALTAFAFQRRVLNRADVGMAAIAGARRSWGRVALPTVVVGTIAMVLLGAYVQQDAPARVSPTPTAGAWSELQRGQFVRNCVTAALAQGKVTDIFASTYCKCVQETVERRYTYSDFVAHEQQYIKDLTQSGDLLACSVVASAAIRKASGPPPIDQNPQNPRVEQSVDEEFVSETHRFRIRRPAGWANSEMDGQMQWCIAANDGQGPDTCCVKVSEDWSFGIMGNEGYLDKVTREQFIEPLGILFESPSINTFDRYSLGGQEALRVIYTGVTEGERCTTYILQTIRGAKLYTFAASSPSSDFPNRYLLFQRIENTFSFTQ